MLRIIDMLKASADREVAYDPEASVENVAEPATVRSDDIQAETERSRSPATMGRQAVRADLARMMRSFGVKPDDLLLYQDEISEAEYVCALCRQVGRCRAWSAKGCRGDAPRLFCANAAFFEEITPDLFWSETAPGAWHSDTRTSPLLRLLASVEAVMSETPPKLSLRKLERFISVASAIDALRVDRWPPTLAAPVRAARVDTDLDADIDKLFDHQDSFGKADFARILQVALCDPRLAECLCHLHDRSRQRTIDMLPIAI